MFKNAQLTEDQEKLERELTPTRHSPSGTMDKVTLILSLLKSAQGLSGGGLPASTIRLIGLHYKWAIFETILAMKKDSQHDWLYHALLLGRDNQPAYDIGRIFYVQRGMFACNIQRGTLFWAGEKIARPLIKAHESLIRKREVENVFGDDVASLVLGFLENKHTFETHQEMTLPSSVRLWDGSLYDSFCCSLGVSSFSSYIGATGLICLGFLGSMSSDYRRLAQATIMGFTAVFVIFGLCALFESIREHQEIASPPASPVGSSSELMHLRVASALSFIIGMAVIVLEFLGRDLPVLAGPAAGILLGVFSAYWHHSGLKLFKQRLNPLPMLLVKEEGGSNLRC